MLRVYRVGVPTVYYQSFHTDDFPFIETVWPRMHGDTLGKQWKPPQVYVHKPRLKEGHFMGYLGGSIFAIAKDTIHDFRELSNFFEQGRELLPFKHKAQDYVVFNCTNCINALDEKKADISPLTGRIKKYAFAPNRFMFSLFTLPESRELFCVEGMDAPHDEFKGYVEEMNLTGLVFEELWKEGKAKKPAKKK